MGLLAGGLLSIAILATAGAFVPELSVVVTIPTVVMIFAMVGVMGVVDSYLPIRRVAKIDPASVFKG